MTIRKASPHYAQPGADQYRTPARALTAWGVLKGRRSDRDSVRRTIQELETNHGIVTYTWVVSSRMYVAVVFADDPAVGLFVHTGFIESPHCFALASPSPNRLWRYWFPGHGPRGSGGGRSAPSKPAASVFCCRVRQPVAAGHCFSCGSPLDHA